MVDFSKHLATATEAKTQEQPASLITGSWVEVARSFSFKLNVGNYESRDFFCSQKAECKPEDAEDVSKLLHDFCRKQVMNAVKQFKEDNGK